jgi:hypothetical protein
MYPMEKRPDTVKCPRCGGKAKRVISVSTVDTESECPAWIRSITDVVDPSDGRAHREFCSNPTRQTYRRFMQETGLRHVESGEKMRGGEGADGQKLRREMREMHRKRNTIYIGG